MAAGALSGFRLSVLLEVVLLELVLLELVREFVPAVPELLVGAFFLKKDDIVSCSPAIVVGVDTSVQSYFPWVGP